MIETYESLDSTQNQLHRHIAEGRDVHGLVVVANRQTSGRGRNGNIWESPVGGSYQSAGFRVEKGNVLTGLIMIALGIGIAEAFIARKIPIKVKWPNDLYLDNRKIGGILGEVARGYLILGVGVNASDLLQNALGNIGFKTVEEINRLVRTALRQVVNEAMGNQNYPARFAEVDFLHGCSISVRDKGDSFVGLARGIDRKGCLLIDRGDGSDIQVVCSGSVETFSGFRNT